jgi:hypothetical protein
MKSWGSRLEWFAVYDRVDLSAIATALMGRAPGRRGERGHRLFWHCPSMVTRTHPGSCRATEVDLTPTSAQRVVGRESRVTSVYRNIGRRCYFPDASVDPTEARCAKVEEVV